MGKRRKSVRTPRSASDAEAPSSASGSASSSSSGGASTSAPATTTGAIPGLGRVATGPIPGSAPVLPLPQPTPPMPQLVVNIKELQRVCGHFQLIEPVAVAQEITRTMLGLFLKIEVGVVCNGAVDGA